MVVHGSIHLTHLFLLVSLVKKELSSRYINRAAFVVFFILFRRFGEKYHHHPETPLKGAYMASELIYTG